MKTASELAMHAMEKRTTPKECLGCPPGLSLQHSMVFPELPQLFHASPTTSVVSKPAKLPRGMTQVAKRIASLARTRTLRNLFLIKWDQSDGVHTFPLEPSS